MFSGIRADLLIRVFESIPSDLADLLKTGLMSMHILANTGASPQQRPAGPCLSMRFTYAEFDCFHVIDWLYTHIIFTGVSVWH
jgi:hypothetical protein